MSLVIPLLLLIGAIPLVLALVRANELFCLRVRGGRLRVVRGRVPQRLLDDLADVVGREPDADMTLRVVVEEGRPRIDASGELRDETKQRLRNTVSTWPVAKLRSAPRAR